MVVSALTQLGGAASWRQLRQADVGWYALWRALQSGAIVRLRRGAYALAVADPSMRAAVTLGGVLACSTAATCLGLPVLVPRGIHVVVPRNWGHASLAGVRVHRRDLSAEESIGITTTLLRTVIDCARELPLREAVVICDAALRCGLDRVALDDAAREARGVGAAAVRAAVSRADPGAESPLESCLRLLAEAFGSVTPQVWIEGIGRVDLVLDGWLVLEADGFEHHSNRRSYREDRRRWNALVALGYTVLRFSYEDVVHHEDRVFELISRVVSAR